MLTEYLFRDDRRLDEYASQINPSLTVVEKTREWTAGLSLAGPKAEAKQGERTRAMTQDEKAKLTLGYLRENASVHEGRPSEREFEYLTPGSNKLRFVHEQCHASRVVVPSSVSKDADNPGLVLWICSRDDVFLCLLEDVDAKDQPVWSGGMRNSGYTALQSLLYHARAKIAVSSLASRFPNINSGTGSEIAELLETSANFVGHDYGTEMGFINNPEQTLAEWGCFVSAPRKIETLYRVREIGGMFGLAIFGYPIWISDAS